MILGLWVILVIVLIGVFLILIFQDETKDKGERQKDERVPREDIAGIDSKSALQYPKPQSIMEPKIVINSMSEYKPEKLNEEFYFEGKMPNPQNDERYYLIFGEFAFKKLKDFLDWGIRTERNCVEQGGVLLGRISYFENEIYCFVKDVLLADTIGNPVFVEFTRQMWASMQDELAEINMSLEKEEQLIIVGWFHTHPNGLPVFMSGTDMNTQRLNFSKRWQASLVVNPHTDKYRVFFGERAIEGKMVLSSSRKQDKV